MTSPLVHLAFDSPWPPYSGAQKRDYGILAELARVYEIDLRVMTRHPLDADQVAALNQHAQVVWQIPRRDASLQDKLKIMLTALFQRMPLHAAIVEHSLAAGPGLEKLRPRASDIVYSGSVYWTDPIRYRAGSRWIIDQQNADVQFWEVYASERRGLWQLVAKLNAQLTRRFCEQVYPNAGCILSVCEEDRALTLRISPGANVAVVPNGIDCKHFTPDRKRANSPLLLFTGTSSHRNMVALRWFIDKVYPAIRAVIPTTEFVIAGDFSPTAQESFAAIPGVRFTGRQPDLRPFYNQAAVCVSPFHGAYGSKLKIAEALAMGTCIVATPAGIRGFQLKDGENVLIGRDCQEFAEQIIRALENKALREQVGRAGREFAEEHLDWSSVIGPRLRELVQQTVGDRTDS